uniref:Uncharacterized protein n=1 Tax=Oryza barthii TaxID=65489 RepID=A0A0D3GIW3_9ORYZ
MVLATSQGVKPSRAQADICMKSQQSKSGMIHTGILAGGCYRLKAGRTFTNRQLCRSGAGGYDDSNAAWIGRPRRIRAPTGWSSFGGCGWLEDRPPTTRLKQIEGRSSAAWSGAREWNTSSDNSSTLSSSNAG